MYHFTACMMHQHRINLDLVCTTTFVHALLRRRVIEKSHLKYHLDVFHVAGMVHKIKKKKRSGKLRKNKINMCGVGVALRPLKKKTPNKRCTKFPNPKKLRRVFRSIKEWDLPPNIHMQSSLVSDSVNSMALPRVHGWRYFPHNSQPSHISHFSFLICPSLPKIITVEFIKTTKERKRKAKAHHPMIPSQWSEKTKKVKKYKNKEPLWLSLKTKDTIHQYQFYLMMELQNLLSLPLIISSS